MDCPRSCTGLGLAVQVAFPFQSHEGTVSPLLAAHPSLVLAGSIPFKMILSLALPWRPQQVQLLLFHFLLPSPSQPFIPNPLCQFDPSKFGGSRLLAWQTQGWCLLREREALGTGRTHTPHTATYPAAFSCLLSHHPRWPHWACLPLRDRLFEALSCVILSDAHVYCSLNRVWRKN